MHSVPGHLNRSLLFLVEVLILMKGDAAFWINLTIYMRPEY